MSFIPESNVINPCRSFNVPLSATKAPPKDGKDYESIRSISISSGMKWLKNISACIPFADLPF